MIPIRVAPRPIACSGLALALLLPIAASADTPPAGRNPITEGYHYAPTPDPVIAPPAEQDPPAATPGSGPQPRKRVQNPALRLPAVPIGSTPPETPPTAASVPTAPDTLVLPKVTVTGEKEKPHALPRLHVTRPVKDLPIPLWESAAGRRARLVQKHFTAREQKLDSQKSLEARAARQEAIESAAGELNRIAAAIDVSALLGQEDAEALAAIRAEFLRAYHGRPR
jgi:hypothetical protein